MVFRRDSKVDAFQRQISALRHQLGGEPADLAPAERDRPLNQLSNGYFRSDLPDLDPLPAEPAYHAPREERALARVEEPEATFPAVPAIDSLTSVIAHTTAWQGNLESTGSLHIHGRVEGSLVARNDIFIAEEAQVDAMVQAANVTVAGTVRGSIECTDRFEILPRGRVAGDIRAPVIVVHDGALIAGEIAMSARSEATSSYPAVGTRVARGGD